MSSDNVYVTNQGNGRVQKFNNNGQFIAAWGTTGDGTGQFSEPGGVDVDNSGHIYVADTGNNRIWVFVESAASTNTPTTPTYGRSLTFIFFCLVLHFNRVSLNNNSISSITIVFVYFTFKFTIFE